MSKEKEKAKWVTKQEQERLQNTLATLFPVALTDQKPGNLAPRCLSIDRYNEQKQKEINKSQGRDKDNPERRNSK